MSRKGNKGNKKNKPKVPGARNKVEAQLILAVGEGLRRDNATLREENESLKLLVGSQNTENLGEVQTELRQRLDELNKVVASFRDLINNIYKLNLALDELDPDDPSSTKRFQGRLAFFLEDLPRTAEKAGIKIRDLSGLTYSQNLPVQVQNAEDFDKNFEFEVDETIRPHLTYLNQTSSSEEGLSELVLQEALVTIKKKES